MAFDIATAKPVNSMSGFDISTAKPVEKDYFGAGVIEPAATIASGMIAEPLAGIAGGIQALNPFAKEGAGADAVKSVRDSLTYTPKTESGKEGLESVGGLVQKGVDVANMAAGGVAGLGQLAAGQGVDSAVDTINSVQDKGLSKSLGDAGFELTGSPLVAAILESTPTAVLSSLGVKFKQGATPSITPQRAREIQQVLDAGTKQGVDVMTSDLFAPKSIMSRMSQQFQERIPVFGTGGKRAGQQDQRIAALEVLEESTPRVESADIMTSLGESSNKARIAAGKRINAISEQMDGMGLVSVDNTIGRIDRAIESLTKPGKIESPELVAELKNLKTTVQEAGNSFGLLREFRTDARSIADKVDPTGRSQLRTTDKALMDGVITGLTKDLDKFVLSNSGERGLGRYKQADTVYRQEAQKLTKSRLKTVLDKGDVKPELVNNLLYSSAPSEVKLLFKNLDTNGRQNARMALLRRALDNSTKQGDISPARFVSELGKMENNFKVFFRGESKAEIEGIKKLMEATRRAGDAGVSTSTGQALQLPATAGVIGAGVMGDPTALAAIIGSATVGASARLYESAGVRNMLIRLGKAQRRSTLEADLKSSIPLILERLGQAQTQEQQEQP